MPALAPVLVQAQEPALVQALVQALEPMAAHPVAGAPWS
jgi:hypothetical protein